MLITVKVFPESKKNKIFKKDKSSYKIEIREKAEHGKGNEAVIDLFSQYFKIPKKNIQIIKGRKQRNKILKIKENGRTK